MEEDRKKAEKEAKEREEEEVRGRVAMEMQRHAQLDMMLREKETERVQAQTQKLMEKAEAGEKRERLESDLEEDEVIIGTVFEKNGITWQTVTGWICAHCAKVHQNCFWQDTKRA